MSVYVVSGTRRYRGHPPGVRFEADLDPDVEQRALRTGAIRLLERTTNTVLQVPHRAPQGWLLVNERR